MGKILIYKDVEIERAERTVLKHVSFSLEKGEFHYLVGRVGSGKSSLMKSIYAEVPIRFGITADVIGYDLLHLRRKQVPELRRKIGIVFQDFQLLQDRSVSGNLRFVMKATGWKDENAISERIDEVLTAVGMDNKSYKMPYELSGGEQQRIVIARALLNSPDLILADEPTGNLDPQTGYQIMALLHSLADHGHCVLMATHNLHFVDEFPGNVIRCENKELIVE